MPAIIRNKIPHVLLTILLVLIWVGTTNGQTNAIPDSLQQPPPGNIRGIEQARQHADTGVRAVIDGMFFVPRYALSTLFYVGGYAGRKITSPEVMERIERIVFIYERRLGWYPTLSLESGTTPLGGVNLFYHGEQTKFNLGSSYADQEKWSLSGHLKHELEIGQTALEIKLSGLLTKEENREFYGIGNDPQNDPRTPFLAAPAAEYGLYTQRRGRVELKLEARPNHDWEFLFTSFFQRRNVHDAPADEPSRLSQVFDIDQLIGLETVQKQIYNEMSIRFDTREYQKRFSPGVHIEVYNGLALGVDQDESQYIRSGGDLTAFIPLIKDNRFLVPRLVFDHLENLKDDVPLAFTDYTRQPAFRAIPSKTNLRTDDISLVPSLEYQWPLTHMVAGSIFTDYLLVGRDWQDLTFRDAPWVVGVGIAVQGETSELGRIQIAGGSEGLKFRFKLGFELNNDRSDWE